MDTFPEVFQEERLVIFASIYLKREQLIRISKIDLEESFLPEFCIWIWNKNNKTLTWVRHVQGAYCWVIWSQQIWYWKYNAKNLIRTWEVRFHLSLAGRLRSRGRTAGQSSSVEKSQHVKVTGLRQSGPTTAVTHRNKIPSVTPLTLTANLL